MIPHAPRRVYLDAAASAPLLPQAREALLVALDEGWADPRRLHREGRRARAVLDGAREAIAACLGARTSEVSFAPSHTQAVHAAVAGVLAARRRPGRAAVVSAVEHSAVLHAVSHATQEVTEVGVTRTGRVEEAAFTTALSAPGVALACLQTANGEVGTLQPVAEVLAAARAAGVPLLVDAAASVGHVSPPPDWDLLTADASAWGGPPGVGLLGLRATVRWRSTAPEHDGLERVPGDVSIPAVLAAAVALRVAEAARQESAERRRSLVERIRRCAAALPDTEVVGDPVERLPHVVTFSCLHVDGEVLLQALDTAGFSVGSGSACTAASLRPSHVLAAMGVLTHGNVRVGLPPHVDTQDVEEFCRALPPAVRQVRSLLEPPQGGTAPTTAVEGSTAGPWIEVDARGLRCPLPVVRLAAASRGAPAGTRVRVLSTDPAAGPDITAWCRLRGAELLSQDLGTPPGTEGPRPAPDPVLTSVIRLGGTSAEGPR